MLVESYRIEESKTHKAFRSPVFNNTFDKLSGFTARWGVTEDDDPDFSPIKTSKGDRRIYSSWVV